jgi:C-terminal processing protease CtpA/Prc
MAKKYFTTEQKLKKYKKRFFILLAAFIFFMSATASYLYMNYDYLAFKHFITHFYIYTDSLDTLYKQELNRDAGGNYYRYFDNVVISAVTRTIREINNDRYTYLYTPERYKESRLQEKEEARQSVVKALSDRTVYLRVTNFSKYTRDFVKSGVEKLSKYPNLIIDLRGNLGGDIDAMVDISSLFLDKKQIIAVDSMRRIDWTYKSKGRKTLNFEKIVILQDGRTASSSENMIAALNDNLDNVTLIGSKTFGKGIGQYTLALKRGFAVKATVLLWYTPNHKNVQGNGIEPEIPYAGEDPLALALKFLEK